MKKYNQITIKLIALLFLVGITGACTRTEFDYCDTSKAHVNVEFDYSKTGIPLSGTTIIFYPADDTPTGQKVSLSTHSSSAVVDILPGKYDVLVINESFGDFSNIRFRNTESYDQVEAFVIPVSNTGSSSAGSLYRSPEILVIDTLSSFNVTSEMVEDTKLELERNRAVRLPVSKTFTMKRAVSEVKVVLHIKGMRYIRSVLSSISGFSEAHILSSDENNAVGITHGVGDIKLSYTDDTKNNGIITGSFNTFGLSADEDARYRLVFDALLIDGQTTVHKEFDITDDMKIGKHDYGIIIDIELGSDENPKIEIPKVEAEQGTSPFDPDVDDWGDNENIDIPL